MESGTHHGKNGWRHGDEESPIYVILVSHSENNVPYLDRMDHVEEMSHSMMSPQSQDDFVSIIRVKREERLHAKNIQTGAAFMVVVLVSP